MKETINVNIAGIAFMLDTESFAALSDFLNRTKVSLQGNPDSEEIVSDIEARIAELILSVQEHTNPVPLKTILPIIEQLGGSIPPPSVDPQTQQTTSNPTAKIPKRLYRAMDGAKVGGVCKGLSIYLGVDPVLVRLLFLLPILLPGVLFVFHVPSIVDFLGGTFFMLYLILWIAVPKAYTARQRLEMQGIPITSESIETNTMANYTSQEPINIAGKILIIIVKVMAFLIAIPVLISAVVTIIALFTAMFYGGFGYFNGEYFDLLATSINIDKVWILSAVAALVLIPMISLGYLMLSIVFDLPRSRFMAVMFFTLWFLTLIAAAVVFFGHLDALEYMHRYR